MNAKTAERLNKLLADSRPVTLTGENVPKGDVLWCNNGASVIANQLRKTIDAILEASVVAVTAAEIRDAAKERRNADVLHVGFSPYNWKLDKIPWHFTLRLWTACRPQILAAIEADNAARLAEYEAYRIACEQGVAVPPQEQDKN